MTTVLVKGEMNTSAENLWNTLKGFDLKYFRGFAHIVNGNGFGQIVGVEKGDRLGEIRHAPFRAST